MESSERPTPSYLCPACGTWVKTHPIGSHVSKVGNQCLYTGPPQRIGFGDPDATDPQLPPS